jgi:hypothetical protein
MNASSASTSLTGKTFIRATGLTGGFASVLVAALLTATVPDAAASPIRSEGGIGPGPGNPGTVVEVACFNTPHEWNDSLDGPLPRCYRVV